MFSAEGEQHDTKRKPIVGTLCLGPEPCRPVLRGYPKKRGFGLNETEKPLRLLQRWRTDLQKQPPEAPKVFEDQTRRRQIVLTLAVVLLICAGLAWAADFVYRIYSLSPQIVTQPLQTAPQPLADPSTIQLADRDCVLRSASPEVVSVPKVFAYLPALDEKARMALRARCVGVDVLLYDAMQVDLTGNLHPQPGLETAGSFAGWLGLEKMPPTYAVAVPGTELADTDIENLLLGVPGAGAFAGSLVAAATQSGAAGACLSLADHPGVSGAAIGALVSQWAPMARAKGQGVCLIAGAQAAWWQDPTITSSLDLAVVLAFQVANRPVAPSSRGFFRDVVLPVARAIPPDRLVLAPGGFGLHWRTGARAPAMLSYADAMLWADRSGATPAFPAETGNTRIDFLDAERRRNQIWLLDAVTLEDQLRALPTLQNIAVWPIGYEDPAVWQLLGNSPQAVAAPIDLAKQIAQLGFGPFVTDILPGQIGHRVVSRDAAGAVVAVRYPQLPLPAQMHRRGPDKKGTLAVTFSGLPNPDAVASLLTGLAARGVHATFFLTFADMLDRPETISAISRAGNGFGVSMRSASEDWPGAEPFRAFVLNAQSLLLSESAGLGTAFVRDPAGRLTDPGTAQDLTRLTRLMGQAYLPVASGLAVPGADSDLAQRLDLVRQGAIAGDNPILDIGLSGAGGQGAEVWALDLIDALVQEGFSFVPLSALADSAKPLDALPAAAPASARDATSFAVLRFFQDNLAIMFIAMLSLDASRSFIYMALAFLRRKKPDFDPSWTPEVTVLVPAYNEETVIDRCLESLIASDYPHMRIVVIDDGSSDHTAEVVARHWGGDARITLLHEENHGKWHAENFALGRVDTPIFIGVDADTVVRPDAISWLVQQFRDPTVGAVAGFVEVGNRTSFLTRCQALEYIVSQAVGRRAFEVFNGILVVPGALGGWRTEAVRKAGLYSSSTITEDADLTVAVHRAGYKVRFEDRARAFTEVPVTVGALVRQRIRWALGMLQTSWKHRHTIREGRSVGFISIIDAIWISFLSSLTAPFVDLLLIALVIKASFILATVGLAAIDLMTVVAVIGYFGLVIVDIILATAAFVIERRRDAWLVALVPLLRFGYRQIMVYAALNALWRALTGRLYGWNKLARLGTVQITDDAVMLKRQNG